MEHTSWYREDAEAAFERLHTSPAGLSSAEAGQRLSRHGANAIPEKKRGSLVALLLSQFGDFMILVLLAAALISGLVGEPADAIAILVIVLLNALVGAVQALRAERAIAALRVLAAPEARVQRDGGGMIIDARELVPGDVVLLEAGNIIPADQLNMAFKGSLIAGGTGKGIVVATGASTEMGRIAELLRGETGVKTPLQQRLTRFGRNLALFVLAICALVFALGLLQGQPVMLMFLTAVSLAVAAIPEALPALNTVFHTQPLPAFDLAVCLLLSSTVLLVVEMEKWLVRRGVLYRS